MWHQQACFTSVFGPSSPSAQLLGQNPIPAHLARPLERNTPILTLRGARQASRRIGTCIVSRESQTPYGPVWDEGTASGEGTHLFLIPGLLCYPIELPRFHEIRLLLGKCGCSCGSLSLNLPFSELPWGSAHPSPSFPSYSIRTNRPYQQVGSVDRQGDILFSYD